MTQKIAIWAPSHKFVGLCLHNWGIYRQSEYGELRPTSGWDRFGSLGHPSYFQRLPRLRSVSARQSSSERQPNFAALNRGRHLCSAGRPSRWALAHISSFCSANSVWPHRAFFVALSIIWRCTDVYRHSMIKLLYNSANFKFFVLCKNAMAKAINGHTAFKSAMATAMLCWPHVWRRRWVTWHHCFDIIILCPSVCLSQDDTCCDRRPWRSNVLLYFTLIHVL